MNDKPKFTLRISFSLHQKLKVMADYNCRSENKEIETAVKRYIRDFEVLHGNIEINKELK